MKHKVIIIEHKDLDMLMDFVGQTCEVNCRKGVYQIRVDNLRLNTTENEINSIYISNDDLMFNKLVNPGRFEKTEEWWDDLILDQTKEYSYKEIKDKFYKELK